jgi:hypothetical protein
MKSCYDCCCMDTADNPIVGIEDDYGVVSEWICTECLLVRLDNYENSNTDD